MRLKGTAPALIYAVIITLVAWSVLRDPAHLTFPSTTRDNYGNFWNLWWVKEALSHLRDPFFTKLLYFPHGTSLIFTEFGPLYGVIAAPWLWVLPSPYTPVAAHNVLVVITFILTGYATFLFARWESESYAGGLLAGLAVTFAAFRFHHIETLNLLSGFWIPLAAWLAGSWIFDPETRTDRPAMARPLLVLAACGFGVSATSSMILSFTVIFLAVWLGTRVVLESATQRPRLLRRLLLAGAAFTLGALPIVIRWLLAASREGTPAPPPGELMRWGADLAGFFFPTRSLALGPLARALSPHTHGPGGAELYLSGTFVFCAAAGLWKGGRAVWPLLLTAGLAFLLLLGPGLWFAGTYHGLGLSPYQLLSRLVPPLAAGRTPERYVLLLMVALAPLAARGLARMTAARGRGRVILLLLFVLLLVEVLPAPYSAERVHCPDVYRRLGSDPSPGAVLEMGQNLSLVNTAMFYQTVHHRPLVGGGFPRPSAGATEFQRRLNPFQRLAGPATMPEALADLGRAGVGFVVWHAEGTKPTDWAFMTSTYAKHAEPWHVDDKIAVFRLTEGRRPPSR